MTGFPPPDTVTFVWVAALSDTPDMREFVGAPVSARSPTSPTRNHRCGNVFGMTAPPAYAFVSPDGYRPIDIWADPDTAAKVRPVARGNKTVPTVVIGSESLVNPSPNAVLVAIRTETRL